MDLAPGTAIKQYTVEAVLGHGGMAIVYAVRHRTLGSAFALKMLRVHSADVARRLLLEGRAQGALRHPNVVAVTDTIDWEGQLGLVMELVEGPSLEQLLARRRLGLDEADALARGILDGVAAAHARDLVHRDLKPGNVLLARTGTGLVPKITDFGLAKLLDAAAGPTSTRSGVGMGTPPYMAPEQIRDAASADARADVFSLGAILYELVTGQRAFDGKDAWDVFSAIQAGKYTPPGELVRDLPDRMAAAIAGALEVDRDRRIRSVDALATMWAGGTATPAVPWDPETVSMVRSWESPSPIATPAEGGTWTGSEPPPDAAEPVPTPLPEPAPPVVARPSRVPWLVGGLALAVGLVAVGVWLTKPGVPPPVWPTFHQLTFESAMLVGPTLSPDGREVAYASDGELYLRRIGGDRAFPLTADVAPRAKSPAFSPDGTRLAFATADGLFVMAADGASPRRVTDAGGFPAWSPDGHALAYVTADYDDPFLLDADGDVAIVDLDGGVVTTLKAGVGAKGVAWSPDGTRLAYWTATRDLFTISREGGDPIAVTATPDAEWSVAWVGDALWYLSDRNGAVNLWSQPVEPSSGAPIGDAVPLTRGALGDVWSFAATADGRRVVYDTIDVSSNVWRAPIDANGAVGVPTRWLHTHRRFGSIALAAGGSALVADTPGGAERLLWIPETGESRELTAGTARDRVPRLSPDGASILYRSMRPGDGDAIYVVGTDGGGERRVGTAPERRWFVWSPDGSTWVAAGTPSVERRVADGVPTGRTWAGLVQDWGPEGLLVEHDGRTDVIDAAGAMVGTAPASAIWLGPGRVLSAEWPSRLAVTDVASGVSTPLVDVAPERFTDARFVSVSGDRSMMAFVADDQTSNLWVLDHPPEVAAVPIPRFERLTWDDAMESAPTLSPTGTTFAYVRDGVLALQRVGGGRPVPLLPGFEGTQYDPAFSPDGQRLAFGTDAGLWVCGATGESPRRVADRGWQPSFTPDGRLLFSTEPVIHPFSVLAMGEIVALPLDGGPAVALGIHGVHPTMSPDGTRIAYWTVPEREVWTVDAEGHDPQRIAGGDGLAAWHPQWSPDGGELYFLSEALGATDLWRVPVSGGRAAGPAIAVTAGFADEIHAFALSADGHRAVLDADASASEIVRVDLASGALTPVVRGRQLIGSFDVFPDGAHLAYAVRGRDERVLIASIDGSGVRELVAGGRVRDPRISPDGRRVALQWNKAGRYDIWLVDVDGGNRIDRTADAPTGLVDPRWAGADLVAMGGSQLWRISAESGAAAPDAGPGPIGYVPRLSPDGRHALIPSDTTFAVVDAATWAPVTTLPAYEAAWWGDDRLVYTDGKALSAYELATGRSWVIAEDVGGLATDVALGPEGSALVLVRRPASDLWAIDLP
jgi:Tol biopolymer transport system component/serine/threonine protein kinase